MKWYRSQQTKRDTDVIDLRAATRFWCHTHKHTRLQFVAFDMAGSPMWAQAITARRHHTHNPQLSGWHTPHLHARFRRCQNTHTSLSGLIRFSIHARRIDLGITLLRIQPSSGRFPFAECAHVWAVCHYTAWRAGSHPLFWGNRFTSIYV